MYPIPKEDIQTEIPPRQHLLFWVMDFQAVELFILSFKLDPTKEKLDWIVRRKRYNTHR